MLERVSFWCDEIRRTRRGYVLDWWGRPVACCILRSIVGGGLVAVMVVREGREGVIDISRGPGEEADITYYYCPVIIAFPGNWWPDPVPWVPALATIADQRRRRRGCCCTSLPWPPSCVAVMVTEFTASLVTTLPLFGLYSEPEYLPFINLLKNRL